MKPMKNFKEGDRFKCNYEGDVWEILPGVVGHLIKTGKIPYVNSFCVEVGNNRSARLGKKGYWGFDPDNWEYLGNFGKSSSFNSLYEKLAN